MRGIRATTFLATVILVAAVVSAGEGFSMKCRSPKCGHETDVIFGGGMAFEQLTGYCLKCKKFVYIHWTREGSPVVDPKAKKVAAPTPLGEVLDARTGRSLTIYACPDCEGPFAEIKGPKDLTHCPVCRGPEFTIDESKPMIAID